MRGFSGTLGWDQKNGSLRLPTAVTLTSSGMFDISRNMPRTLPTRDRQVIDEVAPAEHVVWRRQGPYLCTESAPLGRLVREAAEGWGARLRNMVDVAGETPLQRPRQDAEKMAANVACVSGMPWAVALGRFR